MLSSTIEIDLTDRPRHGRTQILVRCQLQDKQLVERIAKICGMTLAEFVRTTVIKSARKIDEEITKARHADERRKAAFDARD